MEPLSMTAKEAHRLRSPASPPRKVRKASQLRLQYVDAYLRAVRRDSRGNVRRSILLQKIDVDFGSFPAVNTQQAEQLIDIVVNAELAHTPT